MTAVSFYVHVVDPADPVMSTKILSYITGDGVRNA